MPDEPAAGLEQPLLEAGQGPALDGDRQDEPAQQIAQVVGDDPEQQADLVGPEAAVPAKEPPRAAFLADVERLWLPGFSFQIENVG